MAVISILTSLILVVSTFMWSALQSIIAAVIVVVTGMPAYYIWTKQKRKTGRQSRMSKDIKETFGTEKPNHRYAALKRRQ